MVAERRYAAVEPLAHAIAGAGLLEKLVEEIVEELELFEVLRRGILRPAPPAVERAGRAADRLRHVADLEPEELLRARDRSPADACDHRRLLLRGIDRPAQRVGAGSSVEDTPPILRRERTRRRRDPRGGRLDPGREVVHLPRGPFRVSRDQGLGEPGRASVA